MATLLLYGVLLRYAIARPTSPLPVDTPSVNTSPSVYATPSDAPTFDTNYRSTVEIVWSCLTVIIASSWLCVHPNVTGHSTTMWQRLRERLFLFAITLFAPEAMAVFAFYQWRGSKKLYEQFEKEAKRLEISLEPGDCSDSKDHSDSSTTATATVPEESKSLVDPFDHSMASDREHHSVGPAITTASAQEEAVGLVHHSVPDTADRGIMISRLWSPLKTLACTISSFGTDPKKARWSYTHAHFIQMGGIAFRNGRDVGFKKPDKWTDEDITKFFALNLTEAAVSDKSKAGALAKTLVVARVLWFLVQVIARKVQGLPIALLEVASLAFIAFNIAMYFFWWNKPLDVEYPLEIDGIPGGKCTVSVDDGLVMAVVLLLGMLHVIPIGSWIYSPNRPWYPRLYAFGKEVEVVNEDGGLTEDPDPDWTFMLTIAVTSSCFGAFHTIGWYLPAPTPVERTLWRVSCLVLTLYPPLLPIMLLLFHSLMTCIGPKLSFKGISRLLILIIPTSCGIAYIGARLAIMFLPFFELRSLPPLIHRTVSWSRFLSPI